MKNIILIILEVITCYTLLLALTKKYKIDGIYVFGIIATFLSCIMNLKEINIMGVNVPIGFGVTTSLIIAGNIIIQKKGIDELKLYLSLILVTSLISCCFLNLSGLMEASEYNQYANISYNNIFKYNIRIYFALIISIILSIVISSKIYLALKRLQHNIIINNVFSIIITEFIENTVFVLIAYAFEFEVVDIALCIVFRYTIKAVIGIIGTIPMYLANKYN